MGKSERKEVVCYWCLTLRINGINILRIVLAVGWEIVSSLSQEASFFMYDKQYYLRRADNAVEGPYDVVTLLCRYRAGKYPGNTSIYDEQIDQWMPINRGIVEVEKELRFPMPSSQTYSSSMLNLPSVHDDILFHPCDPGMSDVNPLKGRKIPSENFLDAFFWLLCSLSVLFLLSLILFSTSRFFPVYLLVAMLAPLVIKILFFTRLYKAWEVLQNLHDPKIPTPGKAVGFLFIPLYNIYWVFVTFCRIAPLGNKLLRRPKYISRWPFVIYSVSICSFWLIPVWGIVADVIFIPILLYYINKLIITYKRYISVLYS